MPTLTISLKIPFETDPSKEFGSELVFNHWFPDGLEHGIHIIDGDLSIALWFDSSCIPSDKTVDELRRYVHLGLRFVRVRVLLENIPEALLTYMQDPSLGETTTGAYNSLKAEYKQLANRVLASVIKRVNRLIAAARTIKGQHWLQEHTLDINRISNTCHSYECIGRIDNGKAFRFAPPSTDTIFILQEGEGQYVSQVDWLEIQNFVIGEGKTDLVRELLAGASRLADVEHYRASLTEAVTALEVAVSAFSRAPKADEAFGSHMAARLSVPSLAKQVSHLGLSGTVNYLLPTILSEEILPTPIITACQEAVRQRQTVVHNGQRDVDEGFAKRSIVAIKQLCDLLESMSPKEGP